MLIMFVGACLLTGAYGPTDQVFLSVFCFSLFFYALGVGGESDGPPRSVPLCRAASMAFWTAHRSQRAPTSHWHFRSLLSFLHIKHAPLQQGALPEGRACLLACRRVPAGL